MIGHSIYNGDIKSNGQRHGKEATITWSNGYEFKGQMKDGKFHGDGVYAYPSGTVYDGQF